MKPLEVPRMFPDDGPDEFAEAAKTLLPPLCVLPGPRVFTFARDIVWCGTEPTWSFAAPPERLLFYRPRGWLYEWKRDVFDYDPIRLFLDGGPQPHSATLLILELRERLHEMPDTLRAIGIAAVVQLDALVAHVTGTGPR